MAHTSSFKDILDRYLKGEASAEERQLVTVWFEAIAEKESASIVLSDDEKTALFEAMRRTDRFKAARRRRLLLLQPSWKAAAVWSGLLLGGWAIFESTKTGRSSVASGMAVVQVSTGRAEVRKVRLPDSSELWVNANSVLRYSADFTEHRQISLNGEALFAVTHRPGHPFVIETPDGLRTEVLGTRFDIKSYPQAAVSEITVIDGKIRVSKADSVFGDLTRGQAIAWSRRDGKVSRSAVVHPESLAAWITGDWEFDNKGIDDLALLLTNQFGISVVCRRKDLEKAKVSVNFNSRQSAREIIDIFCAFTDSKSRWKDSSTVEFY